MTREEGIKQIDEAQWARDEVMCLNLHVTTENGNPVHAWLTMRPVYCDRGHIQLNIDGPMNLDGHDSFPRYFFSFEEADQHTRTFLKWRLWKERTCPDAAIRSAFMVSDEEERALDNWARILQGRVDREAGPTGEAGPSD